MSLPSNYQFITSVSTERLPACRRPAFSRGFPFCPRRLHFHGSPDSFFFCLHSLLRPSLVSVLLSLPPLLGTRHSCLEPGRNYRGAAAPSSSVRVFFQRSFLRLWIPGYSTTFVWHAILKADELPVIVGRCLEKHFDVSRLLILYICLVIIYHSVCTCRMNMWGALRQSFMPAYGRIWFLLTVIENYTVSSG